METSAFESRNWRTAPTASLVGMAESSLRNSASFCRIIRALDSLRNASHTSCNLPSLRIAGAVVVFVVLCTTAALGEDVVGGG